MRRRTFLRLAGLAPAIGMPSIALGCCKPIAARTAADFPSAVRMHVLDEHDYQSASTVVKVISIDGSGAKAIEQMIRSGFGGIEYICCHTDPSVLKECGAATTIQLGTNWGARNPHAIPSRPTHGEHMRIVEALAGAHMIFIVAGRPGGKAQVVAKIAKELNILTVAIVTAPWTIGLVDGLDDEDGCAELSRLVNTLLFTSNEKIGDALDLDCTANLTPFLTAISAAKSHAVKGIADILNLPGLVGVDFEDVRTVLGNGGVANMGMAAASGPDRARAAAEGAVAEFILEGQSLSDARGVLVSMTGSFSMGLKEYKTAISAIKKHTHEEAVLVCSAPYDETMLDHLRVTIIGTGLDRSPRKRVA